MNDHTSLLFGFSGDRRNDTEHQIDSTQDDKRQKFLHRHTSSDSGLRPGPTLFAAFIAATGDRLAHLSVGLDVAQIIVVHDPEIPFTERL